MLVGKLTTGIILALLCASAAHSSLQFLSAEIEITGLIVDGGQYITYTPDVACQKYVTGEALGFPVLEDSLGAIYVGKQTLFGLCMPGGSGSSHAVVLRTDSLMLKFSDPQGSLQARKFMFRGQARVADPVMFEVSDADHPAHYQSSLSALTNPIASAWDGGTLEYIPFPPFDVFYIDFAYAESSENRFEVVIPINKNLYPDPSNISMRWSNAGFCYMIGGATWNNVASNLSTYYMGVTEQIEDRGNSPARPIKIQDPGVGQASFDRSVAASNVAKLYDDANQFVHNSLMVPVGTDIVVAAPESGDCVVELKPRGYLRKLVEVDENTSEVNGVTLLLGDINEDNAINTDDYIILSDVMDASSEDEDWLMFDDNMIRPCDSDLNGDGVVGTDDYLILSDNFDTYGD